MVIKLGNKTYVKNDKEAVNTLFTKSESGTFQGYYKKLKNRVVFSDLQGKVFAALVKSRDGFHLVNASKLDSGKTFYQYALGEQHYERLNFPANSYLAQCDYVEKLGKELLA